MNNNHTDILETLTQIAAQHGIELLPWRGGYVLSVNGHSVGRVTAEALAAMTEQDFDERCERAVNPPAGDRLHFIGNVRVARHKSYPAYVVDRRNQ